jgi:hypothetical protein
MVPIGLGVGLVLAIAMAIPSRVWTQGAQYVSGLIIRPPVDGNQTLVLTAAGAQFFNVQTATHIAGAIGGAWGTGAKTGSAIIAGRNSSGNGAAGSYIYAKKDGGFRYCWMDVSNNLRCGAAAPEEDGTPSDTSGSVIGGGSGTLWPNTLLVTDYGAACDGSTDDAAAIQSAFDAAAALDAATVLFPAATCKVGSTLTLGGGHGSGDGATFISLVGVSSARSVLSWSGSSSGELLRIELNKYFRMTDLGFANGGSKGTTIGVRLTGPTDDIGTATHVAEVSRVSVSGFHYGIVAGESGHGIAASEFLYTTLSLSQNDVGWLNQDLNTLNHYFINLGLSDNGEGLRMDSGNVYVNGGNTHGSTTADFNVQCCAYAASGTFEIRNVRAELSSSVPFVTGGQVGGSILIENNILAASSTTDYAIDVDAGAGLQVRGNDVSGRVRFDYAGRYAIITMDDNSVYGDDTNSLPFFVKSGGTADYAVRARISAHRNQRAGTIGWDRYYDDIDGALTSSVNTLIARDRVTWGDGSVTLPKQRLGSVAMLAQNSRATGNNLRVAGKFTSAGTLSVAFVRTETVSSNGAGSEAGTQNWIVPSGHFTTADIGRPVRVANGGTDYYYVVTAIVDSTHIEMADMGASQTAGLSLTATVGENEPDANYRVLATCTAAEPIGVSSLATTGFTATSTNSSSTAECTFLIVR